MGERDIAPVPYIVYEGTMARFERIIKKLWVVILIVVFLLVASNGAWLYAWTQYEYSSVDITARQDGRGINIIGGGGVEYGTDSQNQNPYPN